MADVTSQPQDLTTLAAVKEALNPNLPSPATDDDILQRNITRCSDSMANYCSRTFQAQEYTENRNGYGTVAMRLKRTPAWKLVSVTISGWSVPQSTGQLVGGWFLDDDGNFVYIRGGCNYGLNSGIYTYGIQNVQFVYWAGYLTPGQLLQSPAPTFPQDPPSMPNDLERACIEYVILAYRQATRIGDTAVGLGPERISYYMKSMTPETIQTLNRYADPAYPLS